MGLEPATEINWIEIDRRRGCPLSLHLGIPTCILFEIDKFREK